MAYSELILSEHEWQNLLSIKDYAKRVFDVDISRNDGFQTNEEAVHDDLPPTPSLPGTIISMSPSFASTSRNETGGTDIDSFLLPDNSCSSIDIIHEDFVVRPPPIIARIETKNKNSVENLEKCKKLAVAFTPSNPHFKDVTLHIENQHHFEMVQASVASIQQSTAAVVKPCPQTFDLTIQGHYSSVDAACSQVNKILHDLKSKPLEEKGQIHSNPTVDCFIPSFEGINNNNNNNNDIPKSDKKWKNHVYGTEQRLSPKSMKTTSNTTDSIAITRGRPYSEFSQENAYDVLPLSNALREETEKFENSTSNQYQKQCKNNLYDSGPCDSDEDNILSDNGFKKHVDQASKCGFSDKQIADVLRKLGANSSMDDMMRELIQQPEDANDATVSTSSLQQSLTDNDVPTFESKEDNSKEFDANDSSNLRDVVIDGSNIAMSHGHKVFSCLGIKIVVDWFKKRGHKNITVFVPQWRKEASRPDAPISNQEILTELEQERIVVFTPSRRVGGTRIVCYDDRFVLQLAVERNGIVVSNDVYRDLVRERDDFREVVDKRLLMYSFVQDTFMPPEDPLGRQGPSLDNFLRIEPLQPKNKPQNCPYGKKCTYGNKCRFYHPERRYASQKMVAEQLKENAEMKLKSSKSSESLVEKGRRPKPKLARTVSLLPQDPFTTSPIASGDADDNFTKPPLQHSKSSSYLTGSRLKMELAESGEVVPDLKPQAQNSLMANPMSKAVVPGDSKAVKKYMSNSCTTSPRTSPTPINEPVKNKLKEVRSSPVLPMSSPNGIKSALNVPNAETQGRYLSGHLLVAKRLSDEENDKGNFFSQHTSRTLGSSQQGTTKQTWTPNNDSIDLPPESISNQKQNDEDTQAWDSKEIYLPPNIPFQNSYQQPTSQVNGTSTSNSLFYHSSKDDGSSNSESFSSGPIFAQSNEQVFQMRQHHNFKRSLSTHTTFRSPECHQPSRNASDRKYSLNNYTTPQVSASSCYQAPQSQPNVATQFQGYERNKSYDSGISSGLSAEHMSILSPTDIHYPPFNNRRPSSTLSPPPHMARTMMHQPDAMYQSGLLPFHPQGASNPVYPSSSHQWQYSPLPNSRMPFSSHDRSYGDIHNSGSQMNPAPSSQLPFTSPAYSTYYSPQTQFFPSYPPPCAGTGMESQYYQMPAQHSVDNFVARPQPKVIDEDAPIETDDPRYSIYFHLSSLYGERNVRTFMNRNPDITKQGDLLNLIPSYIQDMGR